MYRLLLASVTLLLTTTAWADDCPHRAARDLDIDAAGLEALVIEPGWTGVRVRGVFLCYSSIDRVSHHGII